MKLIKARQKSSDAIPDYLLTDMVQVVFEHPEERYFMKSDELVRDVRTLRKFNSKIKECVFAEELDGYRACKGMSLAMSIPDAFRFFMIDFFENGEEKPVGVDKKSKLEAKRGRVFDKESNCWIPIRKNQRLALGRQFSAYRMHRYVAFLMYKKFMQRKADRLNIDLNILVNNAQISQLDKLNQIFDEFEFVTGPAGSGKSRWISENFDKEKALVLTNRKSGVEEFEGLGFKNVETHAIITRCFENITDNIVVRSQLINSIKNYDTIVVDEFTRVSPKFVSMLIAAKKKTTKVVFVGDKYQLGTLHGNLKPFTERISAQTVKEFTEIKRQNQQTSVYKAVQYCIGRLNNYTELTAPTTDADIAVIKSFEMKHRGIKTETTIGLEYKNIQKAMQLEAGQLRALVKKSRVVSGPLLKLAKEAKLELEGEGKVRTVHYWTLRNGDVVIPARDVKSSSLKAMRQLFLEFKKLDGKKAKKLIDTERTYMTVYASQGVTIKGAVTILTDVFKATLDAVYVALSRPTRGYVLQDC